MSVSWVGESLEDLDQVVAPDEASLSDDAWTLVEDRERRPEVNGALFSLGDGLVGTAGFVEEAPSDGAVRVAGAFAQRRTDDALPRFCHLPSWIHLERCSSRTNLGFRWLDLRAGLLVRQDADGTRTVRFSSLSYPGLTVMRAEWPHGTFVAGYPLGDVDGGPGFVISAPSAEVAHALVEADHGAVSVCARQTQRRVDGREVLERVALFERLPSSEESRQLTAFEALSYDELRAEQERAWAERWEKADVRIHGDHVLTRNVRFALFHLMASANATGEAVVGPRGLTGGDYGGHVFWDADVYVLPFFAATEPAVARAMLEYRLRRSNEARRAARRLGLSGLRFPWESAATGRDVTPRCVTDASGKTIAIVSGEREEHIVADVAWAADCYCRWTGDAAFERGPGRTLFVETARYWASRAEVEADGRAHLRGLMGPDEYHELVDDNAYTNVMARWNLRRAAQALAENSAEAAEAARFRALASALVDGYEPRTGVYEQFAGFFGLEPLLVTELSEVPVTADVLLGRERVSQAQVVKQADVLMLHHMVPAEVEPASLNANLSYYLPRTAHGSSLSPSIHAALLARAGRLTEALELLELCARFDLDDVAGNTAGGVHLANMGGLWQALVFGFLGVAVSARGELHVDPRLPASWDALEARLTVRGAHVRLTTERNVLVVRSSEAVHVTLPGAQPVVVRGAARFVRRGEAWKLESHSRPRALATPAP